MKSALKSIRLQKKISPPPSLSYTQRDRDRDKHRAMERHRDTNTDKHTHTHITSENPNQWKRLKKIETVLLVLKDFVLHIICGHILFKHIS